MSNSSNPRDIIAWLVPTARGTSADKATHLPANMARTIDISASSSHHLSSKLSHPPGCAPQRAIQLCFSQEPLRRGRFVLGTDANRCDVLLPPAPGISAQHCSIGFDAESRLVLDDFSEAGTQVWYDWACSGDQRGHSWILSRGDQRVVIDVQGVRFQLVVNDRSADWEAYRADVDAFCRPPPSREAVPSLYVQPLIRHIFVKGLGGEHTGDVYLWDLSRPWEPMVKASA
ncbi:serine/threonine protein kinase [Metarhizium guizhouense ARSEF 977]|uniref:Serine/threonine protein kinase n=1 Tax=Metarhizium guizhouense (strain ARSEF 977) TaxID=1276136 RepID=A0A0B4GDH9_METGA|nr:serine/threonine protein kinase [Metarhizium guizhouense ARSEF 977]